MDIIKDSKGLHKRVTIQLDPLDKSRIVELQDIVGAGFEGFENYNYRDIHMTIFHFGKPLDLLKDINNFSNQNYEYNSFLESFVELLEKLNHLIDNLETNLHANKISLFDYPADTTKKYGVILVFDNSKQLTSLREDFIKIINDWLMSNSIGNCEDFYRESPNFKYNLSKDFHPHVTLGRVFGRDMPEEYNSEVENTTVTFGNLNFLNVVS